jgi:hypothetical protein
MKTKFAIVIVSAVGVILASSASASLLVNGDFELPNQGTSPSGSQFLGVGSTIPGWTVVGKGGVNVDQTFSPTPYWPGNNSQFMDLTGNTGNGGITSAAFATAIGQTYQVTFDALNGSLVYPGSAYTGAAFSLQASGGSLMIYSAVPTIPTVLTYLFKASGNLTTITFMDKSGFDSNAGWIDNVGVTAVPEASTIIAGALLLLPFGASTLRILRRNRTAYNW